MTPLTEVRRARATVLRSARAKHPGFDTAQGREFMRLFMRGGVSEANIFAEIDDKLKRELVDTIPRFWLNLPDDRYVAALKRIRGQIAAEGELDYYDDNTIGCKDTSCTWGLCSSFREQWPEPIDHLWPEEFIERGRVAPRYLRPESGQVCPFDRNQDGTDPNGCFYRCRIFKPSKDDGSPMSQKRALKLYDETIARAEKRLSVVS